MHGTSQIIIVPLYAVKPDGSDESEETSKEESTTRPLNGNCWSNNAIEVKMVTKQTGEGGDLKKKATVSAEIHKKMSLRTSDKGINKATNRGCLEQFGFQSQSSSLKKAKKKGLPNTDSTLKEEKKMLSFWSRDHYSSRSLLQIL